MRVRHIALIGGSSLTLAMFTATPANAADTIVTFNVTSGGLTITAPAGPVSLGSGAPGSTFGAQIGTVTVFDLRGLAVSGWTATVSASNFTAVGFPSIGSSAFFYEPGAGITTGNGTLTPGADGVMTNPRTAFTYAGGVGSSTSTWNPDIDVTVPGTAGVATYTGEVVHSVSAS